MPNIKKNNEKKSDNKKIIKKESSSESESESGDSIDSDEQTLNDARERFIITDFKERIIKYINIDNLIRQEMLEHREKLNTLKSNRSELEKYILDSLDALDEEFVDFGENGKLTKTESVRKGGINKQIIQDSIYEQLKERKMIKDEKTGRELVEQTYALIENKREKKTKVYLKRTLKKTKKPKKPQ